MTNRLSQKFHYILNSKFNLLASKHNLSGLLLIAATSLMLSQTAHSLPVTAEPMFIAAPANNTLPLYALSETFPPIADKNTSDQQDEINPAVQIPMPGPLRQVPTQTYRPDSYGSDAEENERDITRPHISEAEAKPVVLYDPSQLPQAVQEKRLKIINAAKSGNIEALRPLLGSGEDTTLLSLGEYEAAPLDYLKNLSGDNKGQEILAIIIDLLNSGYVHLDAGTPNELYVWPYFFAYPMEQLNDRQMVELYQIITAGDYEEMKQVGAYVFYRLGISPDGKWHFFVAGD